MSSPDASNERPLSPHLQVYRWQITNTLSILHRLTGFALSAGTLLLVYWLIAVATGPGRFAQAQALITSWPGQLLMLGWTFSLFILPVSIGFVVSVTTGIFFGFYPAVKASRSDSCFIYHFWS